MPIHLLAILAVILSISPASAAPRELYNKAVRVEYTVTTSTGQHNTVSSVSRTIYVSSTGRLFERHVISNRGGRRVYDNSPGAPVNAGGEVRGMSFRGNTLVATIAFVSGAGEMTVRFDPAFSSCEGTVSFGTERDRVMARRASGVTFQITSIKASNVTCSITSGNPFQ